MNEHVITNVPLFIAEYLQQLGDSNGAQFMSMMVPVVCSFAIILALIILTVGFIYCHNKSRSISLECESSRKQLFSNDEYLLINTD